MSIASRGWARRLPAQRSTLALAVLVPVGGVLALGDADLIGNWCGSESNYSFSRKVMIVTRPSDSSRLVFDITAFEPREGRIAVSWRRADGKVVRTEFAEFSTDGKRMVQLSNSGGPRREFKRC